MRTIHRIDPRADLPKQVDRIKQWLELLRFEYVILADLQNKTYTFLLTVKDCPDLNITLENGYSHISFFSNALTELKEAPEKVVLDFLKDILNIQGQFFTGRIILTSENEELRIFNGYRYDEMSMYRFARKVRELLQFLKELSLLIEKYKLKEIWRDTEQEHRFPKIDIRERVRFI
ncbi:hypothetical protein [Candidatus Hodarchaeum mangrovi]